MCKKCSCVAGLLCLIVLASVSATAGEDLYLGLNHSGLFSRCGMKVERVEFAPSPDSRFPASLVLYHLAKHESVSAAVYTSVDDARRAFAYWRWILPMAPPPPPEGEPIGDEMQWGGPHSGGGGSVTFRRGNVVFGLRKGAGQPSAVELARQIDRWIQEDREIAPRGRFAEPPEIVSVGAPEGAAKGARVRLAPVFRGLGDPKDLRVAVIDARGDKRNATNLEGKSDRHIVVMEPRPSGGPPRPMTRERTPEEDGRFELSMLREEHLRARGEALAWLPEKERARRAAELAGPLKFTMIVATPENLIVTKEFTVTLTDE